VTAKHRVVKFEEIVRVRLSINEDIIIYRMFSSLLAENIGLEQFLQIDGWNWLG